MKLNSIQFLRAVAALLVVYEHSMEIIQKYDSSWQQKIYHLKNFGCIGVDLFFVISGFIITYVANKYMGSTEGLHFLAKRFIRINPVYYIATALVFGVYLIQLQVTHTPFENSFNKTMSSLMDSILVFPTSNTLMFFNPLLVVGWTLSFEWLFYLLFFTLILFNVRRKTFALPILILILVGLGLILKPEDLRLQFLTNPIMLEFVLGVIICQVYLHSKKVPLFVGISLLTIGLISYLLLIRFGYGYVWYYKFVISGQLSLKKTILWGIPSSCIVAGCVFLEKNVQLKRVFNNKWVLLLGDASYSIYLVHFTIYSLVALLYKKNELLLPADIMIWLQFILATAIAVGFYKLVESPLLNLMYKSKLWDTMFSTKQKKNAIETRPLNETINPLINIK